MIYYDVIIAADDKNAYLWLKCCYFYQIPQERSTILGQIGAFLIISLFITKNITEKEVKIMINPVLLMKEKQVINGFTAQIIQHEMDHFEGIII